MRTRARVAAIGLTRAASMAESSARAAGRSLAGPRTNWAPARIRPCRRQPGARRLLPGRRRTGRAVRSLGSVRRLLRLLRVGRPCADLVGAAGGDGPGPAAGALPPRGARPGGRGAARRLVGALDDVGRVGGPGLERGEPLRVLRDHPGAGDRRRANPPPRRHGDGCAHRRHGRDGAVHRGRDAARRRRVDVQGLPPRGSARLRERHGGARADGVLGLHRAGRGGAPSGRAWRRDGIRRPRRRSDCADPVARRGARCRRVRAADAGGGAGPDDARVGAAGRLRRRGGVAARCPGRLRRVLGAGALPRRWHGS